MGNNSSIQSKSLLYRQSQSVEVYLLIAALTAITTFIFDVSIPLGVAGGIPYVAVVLVSYKMKAIRWPLLLAGVSSILVIIGLFISPGGNLPFSSILLNRCLTIFAIWIIAALIFKVKEYEFDLIKTNEELMYANNKLERSNADLENKVQQRTYDLQQINQELEDFSFSASHDLRAPLRRLGEFSQILLKDYATDLDETGKDYLKRISSSATKMAEVIEGLLLLSKITKKELDYEDVNLTIICREIIKQSLDADEEIIQLEDEIKVRGDKELLRIVIKNLLDNAIKFSRLEKYPSVAISSYKSNGENIICIKDNGVGFNTGFAERLYTPFRKLHKEEDFEGAGLGLAIVKRIVNKHGGKVWSESKEGLGTSFYFTLK